ncbi:MAG: MFS transporter [Leptospirales bacterium]
MSFFTTSVIPVLTVNRILRGIVQGFLLARFLPDIHDLGWSTVAAGTILSGGLLFDFLLTLFIGHHSDRSDPTGILILGEFITMATGAIFLLFPSPVPLGTATFLAGLGQRSNGSPGPYAPAEQSLLLANSHNSVRFKTFTKNTGIGLLGMAAGAFLGGQSHWARIDSPMINLKSAMIALVLTSLVNILLLRRTALRPRSASPNPIRRSPANPLTQTEKRHLALLVSGNLFAGIAIGLTDPTIAYWFLLRFHTTPDHVSFLLSLSYLVSALFSFLLTFQTSATRLIRTAFIMQALALLSLVLLPITSILFFAFMLYTLRLAFVRAPGGIRQAMAGEIVHRDHAGWAASLHFSSLQGAQIAGPFLAGFFWKRHWTNAPLFLASFSTALSLILFLILYRNALGPNRTTVTVPSP